MAAEGSVSRSHVPGALHSDGPQTKGVIVSIASGQPIMADGRGPKQQPFFDDSEACIQSYAILRPSVPLIIQGNKAKIANVKPMGFEADDTEDQREIYVDFVIAKSH